MSERRPGLEIEVGFDPEKYDGQAIPEAIVEDLMEWLAERSLFGSVARVVYDEQGNMKGGSQVREEAVVREAFAGLREFMERHETHEVTISMKGPDSQWLTCTFPGCGCDGWRLPE